jgi:hypothetical protein
MAVADRGRAVTAVRVILMTAGLALGAYGAVLLWENPTVILKRIVVWALVAVVLHDLVFAPLSAVFGYAGRRLIPLRWWPPVAVAVLCTVVLVIVAVPVFDKPGMRPDNMTVLDRDYHLGLALSLGVVWLGLLCYMLARRLLPVRQDQVVQRQRADDVDAQPPAV